jgi:(p)ppGpp synthase/HD superfamily hydrolase
MSSWGLVIKLADRLDNVSDLKDASEKFREKYSKETKYILNQLEKNRELTKTQNKIMREIKKKLKELQ